MRYLLIALVAHGVVACSNQCSSEYALIDGGGSPSADSYTDSGGDKVTQSVPSYRDRSHHYLSYIFEPSSRSADWICRLDSQPPGTTCDLTFNFAKEVVVQRIEYIGTGTNYDSGRTTIESIAINGEQVTDAALDVGPNQDTQSTFDHAYTTGPGTTMTIVLTGGGYGASLRTMRVMGCLTSEASMVGCEPTAPPPPPTLPPCGPVCGAVGSTIDGGGVPGQDEYTDSQGNRVTIFSRP